MDGRSGLVSNNLDSKQVRFYIVHGSKMLILLQYCSAFETQCFKKYLMVDSEIISTTLLSGAKVSSGTKLKNCLIGEGAVFLKEQN